MNAPSQLGRWPTREEWAAEAERYARTLCDPHQRVSADPEAWLTADQYDDLHAALGQIVKDTRREIGRALKTEAEPRQGELRSDRKHLNHANRRARREHATADDVRFGVGDVVNNARDHLPAGHAPLAELRRLAALMRANRDAAARQATEEAVAREIAKRSSDEGWRREQERRARIDGTTRARRREVDAWKERNR